MAQPAIQTRALSKRYRPPTGWFGRGPERLVVDAVDLRVDRGELFVLLGRNGAGKTTLIKMLCTLVLPSSGEARVMGHDVVSDERRVRQLIGYVTSEERSFYWRLSGRHNLEFFGALHDLGGAELRRRISMLAVELELEQYLDRRFDSYSTGMRQKLAVARALLGRPELLVLDEPTRSLDPTAARELRELIQRLVRERGITVLLVTHQLDECRQLAQRYGLMRDGHLEQYQLTETDPTELF